MTTFDDREHAFEAKFAHDTEMQFRAEARRNKLVGLWAAGLLGKSGDEAADYAMRVVRPISRKPGTRTWCARSRPILAARPAPTRCAPR